MSKCAGCPPRTVAARGARGGYRQTNFEQTRDALLDWLTTHPEWQITGDAYGVFWDGPFTPWFRKTFEVHIPVQPVDPPPDLAPHRWQHRVIVVRTPFSSHPSMVAQQTLLDTHPAGLAERDVVVRVQRGAPSFSVELYGKDGGSKLRQTTPLSMDTLFTLIDSMPMRQSEMRHRPDSTN